MLLPAAGLDHQGGLGDGGAVHLQEHRRLDPLLAVLTDLDRHLGGLAGPQQSRRRRDRHHGAVHEGFGTDRTQEDRRGGTLAGAAQEAPAGDRVHGRLLQIPDEIDLAVRTVGPVQPLQGGLEGLDVVGGPGGGFGPFELGRHQRRVADELGEEGPGRVAEQEHGHLVLAPHLPRDLRRLPTHEIEDGAARDLGLRARAVVDQEDGAHALVAPHDPGQTPGHGGSSRGEHHAHHDPDADQQQEQTPQVHPPHLPLLGGTQEAQRREIDLDHLPPAQEVQQDGDARGEQAGEDGWIQELHGGRILSGLERVLS